MPQRATGAAVAQSAKVPPSPDNAKHDDQSHPQMTAFKSDFLNILRERGFIHQCSDFEGLDALAAKGEATAYVGYDCTARSLHIGNYLTMMMLYWLQQSGNKPITLMGGGTTMVGDPSGKDETRALRTVAEIESNKASIRGVFAKVLRYGSGPSDA